MTASVAHLAAVGQAITSGAIVARPYAHEWWVTPSRVDEVLHLLPEDPYAQAIVLPPAVECLAMDPVGRDCERFAGHRNRHLAVHEGRIVSVWGSR